MGGGPGRFVGKSPTNIKGTWNQSPDNSISQFNHYILSFCARLHVRIHKDARSLKPKMCNRSQLCISAGGKIEYVFQRTRCPLCRKLILDITGFIVGLGYAVSAGYGSALDLIIHYLSWEISVIPKTDRPIHFFCHVGRFCSILPFRALWTYLLS